MVSVLFSDVYKALDTTGLVVVGGTCPVVGVAGLVLGGGKSFLSPMFGLASDNMVAAEMITADGALLKVQFTPSKKKNTPPALGVDTDVPMLL
jgi:FAD/FMN-containing dehydrogenase